MSVSYINKLARLILFTLSVLCLGEAYASDAGSSGKQAEIAQKTKEFGGLSMSLTLSPSDLKSKQPADPVKLIEERTVESSEVPRTLEELKAEIDAVEQLIKARRELLDVGGADTVMPTSASSNGVQPTPRVSTEQEASAADSGLFAQVLEELFSASAYLASSGSSLANPQGAHDIWSWMTLLAVMLLLVLGYVWLQRRKLRAAKSSRYKFDGEIKGTYAQSVASREVPGLYPEKEKYVIDKNVLPDAEIEPTIVPPEYEKLAEADVYLRFGHEKLAEDALREAISINPGNPQPYLSLLQIYYSREDRAEFSALAEQLNLLGEKSVWPEVAEMGRTLDGDNPLYR